MSFYHHNQSWCHVVSCSIVCLVAAVVWVFAPDENQDLSVDGASIHLICCSRTLPKGKVCLTLSITQQCHILYVIGRWQLPVVTLISECQPAFVFFKGLFYPLVDLCFLCCFGVFFWGGRCVVLMCYGLTCCRWRLTLSRVVFGGLLTASKGAFALISQSRTGDHLTLWL